MFCDVKDVISSIFFVFYLVVSCHKYSCWPPQNTIFWYMTLNFHFERVLLLNVTMSGPIRCKIGIWYFSTMNTALRRKSRNWLMWNQDNLSKWYNMSTCGSMFLWASTTCLSSTDIISSNCNIKQQHSLKVKHHLST
jgi:hypothetical protein